MTVRETMPPQAVDVLVLGGGPAGAAAARRLAQRGRSVLILDKETFPRFHVGESLIPQDMDCIAKLGLTDVMQKLPRARKRGVEFVTGDGGHGSRIAFADALGPGPTETFNVERAAFDKALLDAAADAGAQVRTGWSVTKIETLADGAVSVLAQPTKRGDPDAPPQRFEAKYLFDASGQATLLGRHLKTRQNFDGPEFQKIAYFGHFTGVATDNALGDDCITMVLCDEGWFWMIPLDDDRVSVGLVLDAAVAKRVRIPANQMLAWGIARCPLVLDRLAQATCPERNGTISDYSYSCAPYAGPGYFLIGDAATFLDPVFSTGLFLGMEGALRAADAVDDVLAGRCTPEAARKGYAQFLGGGVKRFFRLIRAFYDPAFRDLFLNGSGPLALHRALIALLAGRVFPRPTWAVRWRMALFYRCVSWQRRITLVPRHRSYALWSTTPAEVAVQARGVPMVRKSPPAPAEALTLQPTMGSV